MKNKLVLLRSGNVILEVLGQFRMSWQAEVFIEENYPEFRYCLYQWNKFQSPEFITIE